MNIAIIQTKTADGENFDREFMLAQTTVSFSSGTISCGWREVAVPPGGSLEISAFEPHQWSPESDIEQARRERKA